MSSHNDQPESTPLTGRYDVAMLDLDGVIYSGEGGIDHAAESLEGAVQAGMQLAFVTNNASRTPDAVRDHLQKVGVPATVEQIITSAQVAARVLARRVTPGGSVLVVGDVGLRQEVLGAGFRVVENADEHPDAVVQGHSPNTGWQQLAEATAAVRAGALWVATNLDSTLPSPRGPMPGNGSFVTVIQTALGRGPDEVAGKPDPWMHSETVRRTGAAHPLVIGDRLDTDIEGANRVGVDSLLVMTGVATPREVIEASPQHRPTFISADLRGLLEPARVATQEAGSFRIDGCSATVQGSEILLTVEGDVTDPLDLLRVLAPAAWSTSDQPTVAQISYADDSAKQLAGKLGIVAAD